MGHLRPHCSSASGWLRRSASRLKLTLPGRFDRLSLVLYLLLGWSGVMMYDAIIALPAMTLWLLGAGACFIRLG